MEWARKKGRPATHFIIGQTPDGGRLGPDARKQILRALESRLNVVCGSHDYFSYDLEVSVLARRYGLHVKDVRKPPPIKDLHSFSGKIEQVECLKVALLGTDSAVGKRTTAMVLVDGLNRSGLNAVMVGTGQTSWIQGEKYCIILDSLINDFVAGEIEHAVWRAWKEVSPDVILIEGQGSLMNPAYPGGFEILAAGRPDAVILQHPPARKEYDGFPGYPLHPLDVQIKAVELIGGRPVMAVTVNHEDIPPDRLPGVCARIEKETGLPAVDVLAEGPDRLVRLLAERVPKKTRRSA